MTNKPKEIIWEVHRLDVKQNVISNKFKAINISKKVLNNGMFNGNVWIYRKELLNVKTWQNSIFCILPWLPSFYLPYILWSPRFSSVPMLQVNTSTCDLWSIFGIFISILFLLFLVHKYKQNMLSMFGTKQPTTLNTMTSSIYLFLLNDILF